MSSRTEVISDYDLQLPPSMLQAQPKWFSDIPWHLSAIRPLTDDAIATIEYMDAIEGHVCAGYLHLALASAQVRATTERTDFVAGWGVQENWHGIALHRFLDEYHGIKVSSRARIQDARRRALGWGGRHSPLLAGGAASVASELYPAVYACVGYRNEVMTLRGYGSLLTKINSEGRHPVLDPLLRNLMNEEGHHARFYRRIATSFLGANSRAIAAARFALNRWWGIVGENFAGSEGADRVILYLFRDARGRELASMIDEQVASLPGLAGICPMKRRVEQALRNERS